jgi:hypothetical protein
MKYNKHTILVNKDTGKEYKFEKLLYDRTTIVELCTKNTPERVNISWEELEQKYTILENGNEWVSTI